MKKERWTSHETTTVATMQLQPHDTLNVGSSDGNKSQSDFVDTKLNSASININIAKHAKRSSAMAMHTETGNDNFDLDNELKKVRGKVRPATSTAKRYK